jgi:hypothetical protein
MSTMEINLAFLHLLGEEWRTFYQSINNEICTMSSSDLYTRVKVLSYKAPENVPPIANAHVSEHQKKDEKSSENRGRFEGGRRGYQGSSRRGFRGFDSGYSRGG